MTQGRGTRPGDLELWHRVARTVRARDPIRAKATTLHIPPPLDPARPPEASAPAAPIPGFSIGQHTRKKSAAITLPAPEKPSIRMDARTFASMKKGKLSPEARLDLHGLTQGQAHSALTGFILRSHRDGKRLVLVITGKGKEKADHFSMPSHLGLLRHQVPRWLQMPPLDHHVLQVTPAHLRHGGEGACYVYLRRDRSTER